MVLTFRICIWFYPYYIITIGVKWYYKLVHSLTVTWVILFSFWDGNCTYAPFFRCVCVVDVHMVLSLLQYPTHEDSTLEQVDAYPYGFLNSIPLTHLWRLYCVTSHYFCTLGISSYGSIFLHCFGSKRYHETTPVRAPLRCNEPSLIAASLRYSLTSGIPM